ncbi:MAG: hypothetical protein GXP48_01965 [Acidobacteria bacterium]|nr:hypothetical protein [Acidobacteriota bacterium]
MRRPLVIGHRGFRARYPANTARAVAAAMAIGADGAEVDIRLTRDGVWVCHHNPDDCAIPVARQRWATLRRNGVDALEDILAAIPAGRWLFLEIKPLPPGEMQRGAGALEKLISPRCPMTRVLSLSESVLETARDLLPGCARSLIFADTPEPLDCRHRSLSPHHRLVERLLKTGCELHPWTVDHPRRIRKLAALGVASITSNDPGLCLDTLTG